MFACFFEAGEETIFDNWRAERECRFMQLLLLQLLSVDWQLFNDKCSMWSRCILDHPWRWFGRSSSMHLGCIYTCTFMWSSTIRFQNRPAITHSNGRCEGGISEMRGRIGCAAEPVMWVLCDGDVGLLPVCGGSGMNERESDHSRSSRERGSISLSLFLNECLTISFLTSDLVSFFLCISIFIYIPYNNSVWFSGPRLPPVLPFD